MVRLVQVILSLIYVAAAASEPQLAPVQHAAHAINSLMDGLMGNSGDSPSSSINVAPGKETNGDVGFSMSGSAVRPPSGSIHVGRPRPTVNDVINALQNLTTRKPDEPGSLPETTIPDVSNVPTTKPIELPVYPTVSQPPLIHDTGAYPTVSPIISPVGWPVPNPNDPGSQTPGPFIPTNKPLDVDPGVVNQPIDMPANQSIIILNLNDLYGLQSGEPSLQQLLSILNGKPGFVFVMTGGQGKFIPLNQLHLLPQNGVPSYVVLLTRGQPNPFPGLQLINGLYQNGNQGNLGFQIPNLGNFASLPIYVVQGYYPITTILMNLGMYQPDNGNYYPHPDPTPYPGIVKPTSYPSISIGSFITAAPTSRPIPRPTNPPVVVSQQPDVDLTALLSILGKNNGKGFPINSNKDDVSDSELIKILLQVLNEKPGSETEHVIIQEKRNPTKLLRILIELLCQKNGQQQIVIEHKNENNPSKLLQILIQLLRQKNGPNTVVTQNNNNSEERLIQLLIKLIRQQDQRHMVISHNNNDNQAKLMQILSQLLGNRDQFNNVLVSSQNNGQSQLLQYLIQLLAASNQEAGHILVSGYNDANSAQRLYNVLLQMISNMPGASNFGGNSIYLNGGSGNSGISSESLMQLVQILLRQQQSNPTIFKNREPSFQPFINGGSNTFGSNSKILTMLLGSGGGSSNKSALWSYLLGNFGCMNHNGLTVLCAK